MRGGNRFAMNSNGACRAKNGDQAGEKRGAEVSEKLLNSLRELSESVERNSPSVKDALARSGKNPDPALVSTAAKYHKALEKLSRE